MVWWILCAFFYEFYRFYHGTIIHTVCVSECMVLTHVKMRAIQCAGRSPGPYLWQLPRPGNLYLGLSSIEKGKQPLKSKYMTTEFMKALLTVKVDEMGCFWHADSKSGIQCVIFPGLRQSSAVRFSRITNYHKAYKLVFTVLCYDQIGEGEPSYQQKNFISTEFGASRVHKNSLVRKHRSWFILWLASYSSFWRKEILLAFV